MITGLPPDDDSPHWVDRSRSADLCDVGLCGYGVAVVITGTGEERFVVLKYDMGEADYWLDFSRVAPHELWQVAVTLETWTTSVIRTPVTRLASIAPIRS